MLPLDWRVSLRGTLIHNFIVLIVETLTLKLNSSSQLYFAAKGNLERRINDLEGV